MKTNDVSTGISWRRVCLLAEIPRLGARVVRTENGSIAVFRTEADEVFALNDRCPHKGGPLSQGIVFGRRVACPLHNWSIGLEDGKAAEPDEGCTATHPVKVEAGDVYLKVASAKPDSLTAEDAEENKKRGKQDCDEKQ